MIPMIPPSDNAGCALGELLGTVATVVVVSPGKDVNVDVGGGSKLVEAYVVGKVVGEDSVGEGVGTMEMPTA
jgi:hypothetical protein